MHAIITAIAAIILLFGGKALANNTSNQVISLIFAKAESPPKFGNAKTMTIFSADAESENRFIFLKFEADLKTFEDYLKESPIKVLEKIKGHDNSLEQNFKNDLDAFPTWFGEASKSPDLSWFFHWAPLLEEEKLSFGNIQIRIDAFEIKNGQYQFLGVCELDYNLKFRGQIVPVDRKHFSKASYLGLDPD